MNILVLTKEYFSFNANAICVKNLVHELEKEHMVYIASLESSIPHEEFSQGNVYHLCFASAMTYTLYIQKLLSLCGKLRGPIKVIKYLILKILNKLFGGKLPQSLNYALDASFYIEQVKKIIKNNKVDCVISVSNPFYTHFALHNIKRSIPCIKWIAYYLDPYTFNVCRRDEYKSSLRTEYNVLKKADNIIITPKMYEEFSTCKLRRFLNKSIICEFPNLVEHVYTEKNSVINFDKPKINCVFVGYLYPKIRSPKFFIELLLKCNKDIKLYIVGGIYGNSEELNLDDYKKSLGERLEFVDIVPNDEAFKIMNDADILINIGNTVPNQLPSKIFDYISIGKPVVNICKIKDCPTLDYMRKYPLVLNIYEGDGISRETVSQFESFCIENKEKRVDFDTIKELYKTSTPEYVTEQIKEVIEND